MRSWPRDVKCCETTKYLYIMGNDNPAWATTSPSSSYHSFILLCWYIICLPMNPMTEFLHWCNARDLSVKQSVVYCQSIIVSQLGKSGTIGRHATYVWLTACKTHSNTGPQRPGHRRVSKINDSTPERSHYSSRYFLFDMNLEPGWVFYNFSLKRNAVCLLPALSLLSCITP